MPIQKNDFSAHFAQRDLDALAAALDAQVANEAIAAGERPLAATLRNFISAFMKVQSNERQLIESIARRMGVRISVYDRMTPRKDPLTSRFPVPLVRVDTTGTHGRYTTLFLFNQAYIAVWSGNPDSPESGSKLRPLGIGTSPGTVHADAINSMGGMLKEFINIHKYNVQHAPAVQHTQNQPVKAPSAAPAVPAGAIQHDRHGDAVPDIPNVPGLMAVKHGRLVEATASSVLTVRDYVNVRALDLDMGPKDVSYVLRNLATAKVNVEAVASDLFQGLADKALQSLAKKLKHDKAADEKQKADLEENRPTKRPFGTNDSLLEENKDPFTGEKLTLVYLLGGRKALMNEHSKVVYPIPDQSQVNGEDRA